jgi:enoyl-CoA hydratase
VAPVVVAAFEEAAVLAADGVVAVVVVGGSVTAPDPTEPPAVCAATGAAAAQSNNKAPAPQRISNRIMRGASLSITASVVNLHDRRRQQVEGTNQMPDATEIGGPSVPIVSIADGRAVVRLNRPAAHNRLEPADLTELHEIFVRVDADPSIRALILTGTGPSFSSGFHLGALAERQAGGPEGGDRDAFAHTVDRLERLRVPTIAALNGGVYGGATDLALACDFRIGVEGMLMHMPAARLGIVYYASGLRRYVTRLGIAATKKLFLGAQPIDADEMLRIAYLDEVVAPEHLMSRAEALAATLAANAPLAVAGLKQAIDGIAAGTLDLEALGAVRARCAASEDHAEALKAWGEKRTPVFHGR